MRYVAAAKSDVGRKRQENEDSFCLAPEIGLYVVADGMGGHAAGEVASRLAVDAIREWMTKYLAGKKDVAVAGATATGGSSAADFLLNSIRLANRVIFDAAQSRRDYAGMGTTVVAALTQGTIVVLAHVGDSRIYRVRDGRIAQVSRDHSFVQQQLDRGVISVEDAQASQYRHMITRALGLKEAVEVDLREEPAEPGDILLLCSDGLSDLLEDEEILAIVREHPIDLDFACRALVDRANYKGGDDNITALLIRAQAGGYGSSGVGTTLRTDEAVVR
jgi:serine/threonine protein phosphatase PrpC